MPRLRKAARLKRERPKLAPGIWEWLAGKKTFEELDEMSKVEILVLETPHREIRKFWDRVRQAVLDGDLEVSPDAKHYLGDQLLPTNEKEAVR